MAGSVSHEFRIIDTCPCPKLIAPYIWLAVHGVGVADSIYRGDDARALLNKYGHHSQYQLYHATPAERAAWGIQGEADRPGFSTHELRSDGRAYPGISAGQGLDWWMQGFDMGSPRQAADVIHHARRRYGWELFLPYSGPAEAHHLNFRHEPRPRGLKTRLLVWKLRRTLPRS